MFASLPGGNIIKGQRNSLIGLFYMKWLYEEGIVIYLEKA